jgi:hypothetical protein
MKTTVNYLKKMMVKALIIIVLMNAICFPLTAQNTLNTIGLTSARPAAATYSLRSMSSTYSGPLVRILIGSSYYDVYPDASTGFFATSSLVSAAQSTYNAAIAAAGSSTLSSLITAGTTTATVAIWYDQSGNANNAVQATVANQPRIIYQGNIETLNGNPTIRFVGSSAQYFESVNNVSISGASSVNAVAKNLTASANSASIVTTKAVLAKDGLTSANASTSAYQIKQDYPSSTDGFYWIQNANINGGAAFKIYADMTTDGGGWTLIMKNSTYVGWTYSNAIALNTSMPFTTSADVTSTSTSNYSIIGWADNIKKSSSGFQYMIDVNTRRNIGGIWTANAAYSFTSSSKTNTNITLNTKFSTWDYNNDGVEARMPWYSNQGAGNAFITTDGNVSGWWGTLITGTGGWVTAPWMSQISGGGSPSIIWYWVR